LLDELRLADEELEAGRTISAEEMVMGLKSIVGRTD
jgi:hypothetical protein